MQTTNVASKTIREIVSIAVDHVADPWRLSLVQRDLVWTEAQVRYLLDSLLFGYPIGSILLCRVSQGGAVIERSGGTRRAHDVGADVWQLLDGQQRVTALVRLFAAPDAHANSRILLSLTADRDLEDVVQKRSNVDRSLRHIRLARRSEEPTPRWEWLDVSGMHQALGALEAKILLEGTESDEQCLAIAQQIDPQCTTAAWSAAPEAARQRAADRVRRLVRAYVATGVPIVELSLDSPIDVLQVFTRVNRTGVQVAGEDVFFAAVKTLWRDAEEHLHRLQQAVPFLGRASALRFVARYANMQIDGKDLLPLDVEKLNGERGRKLVERMAEVTVPDSPLLLRLRAVASIAAQKSGLGHALRHLPQSLFDPVLAWAAGRPLDSLDEARLAPAWAFVFGANAFRYRTIFGDTFERMAFEVANRASDATAAFPLEAIAAGARGAWPTLSRGRQTVRTIASDGDKRDLVHDNTACCLLVVQEIPFELPPDQRMDWEHFFPSARVDDHLRWKKEHGKARLQRHPDSWCVSRAGNLMALDEGLNRSAGKQWPDEKLKKYQNAHHWPPNLFLSDAEMDTLTRACEALRDGRVPEGAGLLAAYVRERELRIFADVMRRFPGMALLANGPAVE